MCSLTVFLFLKILKGRVASFKFLGGVNMSIVVSDFAFRFIKIKTKNGGIKIE
jgi:hypothetical protein